MKELEKIIKRNKKKLLENQDNPEKLEKNIKPDGKMPSSTNENQNLVDIEKTTLKSQYEKMKTELHNALEKKKALTIEIESIEEQVYRYENLYLRETALSGNIIRGFDNYLKNSSNFITSLSSSSNASMRRKLAITDNDRIFSRSSIAFSKALYHHNQQNSSSSNANNTSSNHNNNINNNNSTSNNSSNTNNNNANILNETTILADKITTNTNISSTHIVNSTTSTTVSAINSGATSLNNANVNNAKTTNNTNTNNNNTNTNHSALISTSTSNSYTVKNDDNPSFSRSSSFPSSSSSSIKKSKKKRLEDFPDNSSEDDRLTPIPKRVKLSIKSEE